MAPLPLFLLSLLSLLSISIAAPAPSFQSTHITHHSLPSPPPGWVQAHRAPSTHLINLTLALAQPSISSLHSHLLQISDPSHPRYGQHLTKGQVELLSAPSPESLRTVSAWLLSQGVDLTLAHPSAASDRLTLSLPLSLVEQLLQAEYYVFLHPLTGETLVRTLSYSLPREVAPHVRSVQPTTIFSRPRALDTPFRTTLLRPLQDSQSKVALDQAGSLASNTSDCTTYVTPACLSNLYQTSAYQPSGTNATSAGIGITGYLGQNANEGDLQSFYEGYAPKAVGSSFGTVLVNGGQNDQDPSKAGTEANLDVQYAGSLTHPLPMTFYSTAGSPPFQPDLATTSNTNEPYSAWLDYVLALEDGELPRVVSTSYGDDEQSVPRSWAEGVCDGFAQLGARGVSVIFASGDFGVGPSAPLCKSNDGRNTTHFIPNFPASCPWVTTVGATTGSAPEVAASFSGGGFSNYFTRPEWQDSAVTGYLAGVGEEYTGLYNASGRAYPDVSAQGQNYLIYVSGQRGLVDGTSCSAPTFASVITLLNAALAEVGKPSLGFLNPWLYGQGMGGMRDVLGGANPGCGTEGWRAGEGWDPVTGLGTPM